MVRLEQGPLQRQRRRVLIVGPSMRFASGISTYTIRLANALSTRHEVSVLFLRELLPRALFPGRARVGRHQSDLRLADGVPSYDGLDWHLLPSILGARRFLKTAKPEVIIIPWWTGAVAHMELLIAMLNRLGPKARVVLELHEVMDDIERSKPALRAYSQLMRSQLRRVSGAYVAHSQREKEELARQGGFDADRIHVVPHGTYDHFRTPIPARAPDQCSYLFFGLVRPYKGVEVLVRAFNALPAELARESRLIVAGETWEGYTEPRRLAEEGGRSESISFLDRYLSDEEVSGLFAGSQVAVFPYLRASQSGAVRIAMAFGMPVVASDTGGLGEACSEYEGAILAPAGDVQALTRAMIEARSLVGRRFADPFPWDRTVDAYSSVFDSVAGSS